MKLIDAEGPITFKRLSDQMARVHGFQRTGKEISGRGLGRGAWPAQAYAHSGRAPSLLPSAIEPEAITAFRSMEIRGRKREWREIPHPEKLGLVQGVIGSGSSDVVRDVAQAVGVARVTNRFADEVSDLQRAPRISFARPGEVAPLGTCCRAGS